MGAIASTEMSNKQVIAVFIVGLALLLAAFWAGLSVIKEQAMPTKPGAVSQGTATNERQQKNTAAQQVEPAGGEAMYIVAVADFGTLTQAKQLESELRGKRYFSTRVREPSGQDTLFHVEIGPFKRDVADQIANELAGDGRKGVMILPWKGN